MDQLKDIGAILFASSILILLAVALVLGLKAIWNRVADFGTYKVREREHLEEIAAYKEKVKAISLQDKAKELTVA